MFLFNDIAITSLYFSDTFKYILCFYSIASSISSKLLSKSFKYILCFYSMTWKLIEKDNYFNLNTSYVSIQSGTGKSLVNKN